MKNYTSALISVCMAGFIMTGAASAQTQLPSNPSKTDCSLSSTDWQQWIQGEMDGKWTFKPANSIGFPPLENTKCDFYKWSSQMFLWMMSPASGEYGSGSFVFDSSVFFDVSPADSRGNRRLIANSQPNSFGLRSAKFEDPSGAMIIGETGQAGGGDVLVSQPATGASSNSSLVYYGVHVNDVYAYFLEGQKKGVFKPDTSHPDSKFPSDFPVWPSELQQVVNYAKTQGANLPNAEALTMEFKTSWVDAETLTNPNEHLLINATVPNYVMVPNADKWSVSTMQPTIEKKLALLGVHVVGTVQGHPEMVWATFEHKNNAPDVTYIYENNQGQNQSVRGTSAGSWIFMSTNGDMNNANVAHAMDCNTSSPIFGCVAGDIVAQNNFKISASDTNRGNPWGSFGDDASNDIPNNNAQIISLNNDVIGFLPASDMRRNYILSGAVWTKGGGIPVESKVDGKFVMLTPPPESATEVGSLQLANSTMETYHQGKTDSSLGCFSCHNLFKMPPTAANPDGVTISHIFDGIVPIVPKWTVEEK